MKSQIAAMDLELAKYHQLNTDLGFRVRWRGVLDNGYYLGKNQTRPHLILMLSLLL